MSVCGGMVNCAALSPPFLAAAIALLRTELRHRRPLQNGRQNKGGGTTYNLRGNTFTTMRCPHIVADLSRGWLKVWHCGQKGRCAISTVHAECLQCRRRAGWTQYRILDVPLCNPETTPFMDWGHASNKGREGSQVGGIGMCHADQKDHSLIRWERVWRIPPQSLASKPDPWTARSPAHTVFNVRM